MRLFVYDMLVNVIYYSAIENVCIIIIYLLINKLFTEFVQI